MRKLMLSCLGCLALTLLVLAPSAFAQSAETCRLHITSHYRPGLTTSSQVFVYNFNGQLFGCRSSERPDFSDISGTFEAGRTLNEEVVNSITGATDTVTYQEPVAVGTGDCASSTSSVSALTSWADGTYTVVSYSTTGGLLSGEVAPSMTLTAVNAQPGDPTTFTINTNRFAGDTVLGLFTFEPLEPLDCTTSTGATSAENSGDVALSSPIGGP